jgi:hypothetical protein
MTKEQLQAGDKVKAINPCLMRTTKVETLTIGKEYEILAIELDEDKDYISRILNEEYEEEYSILIIDDQGEEHLFPIEDLETYFDVEI